MGKISVLGTAVIVMGCGSAQPTAGAPKPSPTVDDAVSMEAKKCGAGEAKAGVDELTWPDLFPEPDRHEGAIIRLRGIAHITFERTSIVEPVIGGRLLPMAIGELPTNDPDVISSCYGRLVDVEGRLERREARGGERLFIVVYSMKPVPK